jgi:DNA polymerase-3 subunit epsilon
VHRALNDCLLIAALFDRADDLQSLFEFAMRPKAMFVALVSYDDRDLAKKAGFRWNEPGYERMWVRRDGDRGRGRVCRSARG